MRGNTRNNRNNIGLGRGCSSVHHERQAIVDQSLVQQNGGTLQEVRAVTGHAGACTTPAVRTIHISINKSLLLQSPCQPMSVCMMLFERRNTPNTHRVRPHSRQSFPTTRDDATSCHPTRTLPRCAQCDFRPANHNARYPTIKRVGSRAQTGKKHTAL
jgi:hypothetical protein